MSDTEEPILDVAEAEVEEPTSDVEEAEEGDYVNNEKEVTLFGKWEFKEIEVRDISLEVSVVQ
jgi:hypothetical protein